MALSIRQHLSLWLMRHPSGALSRLKSLRYGVPGRSDRREVPTAPDRDIRVLIGPANYAGQGSEWASALEATGYVGAASFAIESPFGYPASAIVAPRVYMNSRAWQAALRDNVRRFTHLLIEAVMPPLGGLYGGSIRRQFEALRRDVDIAFLCHGTDVRRLVGSTHLDWRNVPNSAWMDHVAAWNRSVLSSLSRPVFVSTPDLLRDVPYADWLPVVVDPAVWALPSLADGGMSIDVPRRIRVLHIPSNRFIKGTSLIEPTLRRLDREGIVEYYSPTRARHCDMPALLAKADVVLDQFVLGSYGVAACEAMAAGKVVVGHVSDDVRATVREYSGMELPIREATPASLEGVLRSLAQPDSASSLLGSDGREFVNRVHDGRLSSEILLNRWIMAGGLG